MITSNVIESILKGPPYFRYSVGFDFRHLWLELFRVHQRASGPSETPQAKETTILHVTWNFIHAILVVCIECVAATVSLSPTSKSDIPPFDDTEQKLRRIHTVILSSLHFCHASPTSVTSVVSVVIPISQSRPLRLSIRKHFEHVQSTPFLLILRLGFDYGATGYTGTWQSAL